MQWFAVVTSVRDPIMDCMMMTDVRILFAKTANDAGNQALHTLLFNHDTDEGYMEHSIAHVIACGQHEPKVVE